MSKIWSPVHPRIVWTLGAATLAIAAGPAIVVLVLKALGFVHAAALHTGLLDVGQNVSPIGAAGGGGAGGGGGFGGPSGGHGNGPNGDGGNGNDSNPLSKWITQMIMNYVVSERSPITKENQ